MGQNFEFARIGQNSFAFDGIGGIYRIEKEELKPVVYYGLSQPNWGVQTKMPVMWVDKNQDGQINSAELRTVDRGYRPDPKNWFGSAFHEGGVFLMGRKIFRPVKIESNGNPVYPDPETAPDYAYFGQGSEIARFSNYVDTYPSIKSDCKEFYTITSLPDPGGSREGGGEEGIYRFRKDGKIIWRYSRVGLGFGLNKGLSKPGDLFGAQRFIGMVQMPDEKGGEIIGVGSSRGYFGFLNEDGLFIDQVCHDLGSAPALGFDVIQATNFGGYFFKHPVTGKVYLLCGDTDGRILELMNWDQIRRLIADFKVDAKKSPPSENPSSALLNHPVKRDKMD